MLQTELVDLDYLAIRRRHRDIVSSKVTADGRQQLVRTRSAEADIDTLIAPPSLSLLFSKFDFLLSFLGSLTMRVSIDQRSQK